MPSRRHQIAMTDEELRSFLDERRVVTAASTGRDGRPHLTALWYVVRSGEPWIFTYARSQKVRNLERTPQATLLLESGVEYAELRGAMIYADAIIHRDLDIVSAVGEELFLRYQGGTLEPAARDAIRERAAKRVAVQFRPTHVVSWDHSKLGGAY